MSAAFTNSEYGKPPSEMEELLRGVGRYLQQGTIPRSAFPDVLNRLMLQLLELGHDACLLTTETSDDWNAAVAAMKERTSK